MTINAKFGATVCALAILCACGGAPAQPTTAPLVAAATSAAKATDAPATLTPATPATKTSAATPTDAPKPAPTKENEIAQINFSEMLKNVEKVLKEAGIPYSIAVSDTYTVAGHTIQSVGYASLGAPDKGTPLTVARKAQNQELLTRGLDEWVKEGHSLDDLMIEGVPLKGVRYVLYINAGTFDDGKKVADAINKSNALPHNLSAQGGAWGFEDEKTGFVAQVITQDPTYYKRFTNPFLQWVEQSTTNTLRSILKNVDMTNVDKLFPKSRMIIGLASFYDQKGSVDESNKIMANEKYKLEDLLK